MYTIASRVTLATTSVARQLGYHHVAAVATTAAAAAAHGAGLGPVVFLVLAALLIAALSSAARGLTTVLAELIRVAAAVTSIFAVLIIAILIGFAFLVGH
jgi:hypothetical protein